jgi:hypothetical protein
VLWPLVMLVVMGYASVAGLSEDAFLFLLFTLLQ